MDYYKKRKFNSILFNCTSYFMLIHGLLVYSLIYYQDKNAYFIPLFCIVPGLLLLIPLIKKRVMIESNVFKYLYIIYSVMLIVLYSFLCIELLYMAFYRYTPFIVFTIVLIACSLYVSKNNLNNILNTYIVIVIFLIVSVFYYIFAMPNLIDIELALPINLPGIEIGYLLLFLIPVDMVLSTYISEDKIYSRKGLVIGIVSNMVFIGFITFLTIMLYLPENVYDNRLVGSFYATSYYPSNIIDTYTLFYTGFMIFNTVYKNGLYISNIERYVKNKYFNVGIGTILVVFIYFFYISSAFFNNIFIYGLIILLIGIVMYGYIIYKQRRGNDEEDR